MYVQHKKEEKEAGEAMLSVVICTRKAENARILTSFLHKHQLRKINVLQDIKQLSCYMDQKDIDIVLLDIPFTSDLHELSFALSIYQRRQPYMILLVKKEHYQVIRRKLEGLGIFTIQKPIHKDVFTQLLSFIQAASKKEQLLQETNKGLHYQLQESKLIDRAKCLLIENNGMSEPQAHKYIEKKAMDERCKRVQIAKAIILKYKEK